MKLAIVGGRNFTNEELFNKTVFDLFSSSQEAVTCIVSGGANGADSLARKFAMSYNLEYIEFIPDWKKYGKKAGPIRNEQIVSECDNLIAFWDGKSRGTKSSINLAKKTNKLLKIVYY